VQRTQHLLPNRLPFRNVATHLFIDTAGGGGRLAVDSNV
jgi:hypothetical protein